MKKIMIMLFFIFLSKAIQSKQTFSLTTTTDINNDLQAFDYCKDNKNTYVVIVWPKGIEFLEYIIRQLNKYTSVKYFKTMILKKESIFLLYRALHKKMSYKQAKKYFEPYLSNHQKKPQKLAALIIQTDASLDKVVEWKIEIRKYIGQRYYSLHINDYYWPETIEAAQAVFCDFKSHDLTN